MSTLIGLGHVACRPLRNINFVSNSCGGSVVVSLVNSCWTAGSGCNSYWSRDREGNDSKKWEKTKPMTGLILESINRLHNYEEQTDANKIDFSVVASLFIDFLFLTSLPSISTSSSSSLLQRFLFLQLNCLIKIFRTNCFVW